MTRLYFTKFRKTNSVTKYIYLSITIGEPEEFVSQEPLDLTANMPNIEQSASISEWRKKKKETQKEEIEYPCVVQRHSKFIIVLCKNEDMAKELKEKYSKTHYCEFSKRINTSRPEDAIECISETEDVPFPPGMYLLEDVLTKDEEEQLLKDIYGMAWETSESSKTDTMSRRIQHYGFRFNYKTLKIDKQIEMPGKIEKLCERISQTLKSRLKVQWKPDQCTVNEYFPGQGIRPHIDTHTISDNYVCSLSLESDIVMVFRDCDTKQHKNVLLPRRSLLVLSGEARYKYSHGIYYRKYDKIDSIIYKRLKRVSVTFRNCQNAKVCHCKWKDYCKKTSIDYRIEAGQYPE